MSQHLRLVRKDHVPYLQAAISTSLSQSSPYDAKLVGEDGFVYINRLVFALLHPELACCPILASEVELVALMPGLPVVAIKEMLEGVVRGEWGDQGDMLYPPPVECEVDEIQCIDEGEDTSGFDEEATKNNFICAPEIHPPLNALGQTEDFEMDFPLPMRREKSETFTHAQKLEFVRLCKATGDNVNETARRCGLPPARLRRWREAESALEAQVEAGEGGRSKAVNLKPKQLRPHEEKLLQWLMVQTERPSRNEVSSKAVELYRQEVTDIGARKRFKAGPGYVEQFLAKTRTRHLALSKEQEPQEEQRCFPCDECEQVFTKNSQFKQHKLLNHFSERPFACPHCGRAFKSAENLKIHVRTHTGEKPYECELCGYASADPSNFRKHQKNHHQIKKRRGVKKSRSPVSSNDHSVEENDPADFAIE